MVNEGLEIKSGELIPWGATANELVTIGNAKHKRRDQRVDISWDNQEVLNGLNAQISTTLYGEQKLTELRLNTYSKHDKDARAEFSRVAEHLDNIAVRPGKITYNSNDGAPEGKWVIGKVKLEMHIFDRFGEICVLTVHGKYKRESA
jgi:hypothetical protein